MLTYYVVQSFQRGKRGALIADAPMQAQTEHQAMRMAQRYAETKAGVVAFSRSGDTSTGDFEDAKVLYRAGDLPPLD